MNRTPYDGSPFYCVACDCGFGEFMACDLPICKLETIEAAEARKVATRKQALCPHGFAIADNICGPCSEGRPNKVTALQRTGKSE